jgi:hypothetical protein
MSNNYKRLLVCSAVSLVLAGCATTSKTEAELGSEATDPIVTNAAAPTVVKPYRKIEDLLACINDTGALHGLTFVIGPFADSTGKVNSVAIGATGNFLPQGGSASYITDAVVKAGGRVVSTYFGQPRKAVRSEYALNGIFNSLDFGAPVEADVRVGGVGPTFKKGWAQLTLSMQLDEIATNVNRQISMIQRPVRYTQIGVGIGRTLGNTLVTGNVAFQNQERLQFEALNGPIALGVADVLLKEFPRAGDACGQLSKEMVNS